MEESNKHTLLLKYGPREYEIFNYIKSLSGKTNVNDNRNEIIRRGLQSFQYLIQADESSLLQVLSTNLKKLADNFDDQRFNFVKNLAIANYAIMISKNGISESELFESIITNLNHIEEYKKNYHAKDSEKIISQIIDYISKSLDLIFLKKDIELSTRLEMLESYYYNNFKVQILDEHKKYFISYLIYAISNFPLLDSSLDYIRMRLKDKESQGEEKEVSTTSTKLILKSISK